MIRRYAISLALLSSACLTSAEEKLSYNQHVKPILSDKCFLCHGPDVANNKAGLRLDLAESAYADLHEGSGKGIIPGDAENSEVYKRMISHDPDLIMPTPESNLVTTKEEQEIIKRWINEGAEYEEHWAFTNLPKQVKVPEPSMKDWVRNPIDNFVLRKLDQEGLKPASETDPLRWFRRANFDLTGLPPSVTAVRDFERAVAEKGEAAFTEAVDGLLASPSYGEHIATEWLDAARYADSYGYQSDKLNTQWPYRDWVIKAFNDNLPYDEFLTWQLAGDLLENPTREQRLATAFNRIHRLNNEGGAIFEEWRTENIADRVHTYGTAVLALTMECTKCHDHKYDPITARDYFSLFAFFNSIDENGMYDRTEKVPSPTMLLPTDEQQVALDSAKERLLAAKQNYETVRNSEGVKTGFSEWSAVAQEFPVTDNLVSLTFDSDAEKDRYYTAENDHNQAPSLETVTLENGGTAVKLDGDRGISVKDIPVFDRWTPFTVHSRVKTGEIPQDRFVISHYTRGTDAGYNGWDLTSDNGYLESRIYRVWPGNAIGVRTKEQIPANQWMDLTATYDGSSTAAGLKIFIGDRELETEIVRDEIIKAANVEVMHGGKFAYGFRFRDRGFAGAELDKLNVYSRDLSRAEIVSLVSGQAVSTESPDLESYYASVISSDVRGARAELNAAVQAVADAEEVMNEIPIMRELPEKRPSYILARGEYDAPKTEDVRVYRDTFEHILPRFEGYEKDRLGLAKWSTQPDHPLTSRVYVNRLWQRVFGQGLVDTPENFGFQGALPSHPQLLDWLSRDFVDNGWDIKRALKQMVLSSTYRQASSASKELMERDPKNVLLARGPAYRLSAEQIRDMSLAASGLLNPKMGGPPVSPYQPGDDLWRESNTMSPAYKQDVGKALYRRSVYSVIKRTAPLPNMLAFDATAREVCAVNRSRTNTPLQALVLLNDVQFVEAARALAEEAMKAEETGPKQIQYAFTALAGRSPDATEMEVLSDLLSQQTEHYAGKLDEAEALIGHGDSEPDASLDPTQLAALTTICQAMLSLDATIWKR